MKPFTILLFIVLLHQLISVTVSQPNYLYRYCNNDVNYTANSTYRQNLNTLLSNFSTSDIPDGFYNLSVGNPPDQVYGVVLCRGDVSQATCRSCVNDSTVRILQNCPTQIEAIGYYDYCMLRFTNRSIFGVASQGSIRTYYKWNNRNVSSSELDGFNRALQSLLSNLSTKAALGDSRKKFATGSSIAGFSTIYGLTQCTPDISGRDCENCLVGIVSEIPAYMAGKVGGRILKPNCNFRYEIYQFTQNTVAPPPPPTLVEPTPVSQGSPSPPPLEGKSSNTERTILLIVIPAAVGVAILIICMFICFKKQKSKRKLEGISDKYVDEIEEENSLQFDLNTISAATNDFSDQNKLGQGGFGAVYKGTFINGQDIAVKRLSANSGQGDLEFKTEVVTD